MDDVWGPTLFLHGLEHAACKEDCTLAIVGIFLAFLVFHHSPLLEVIFIVDEIYLNTGNGYRGNLDDQRMVGIVDDEVHSRETDHFV